MNDKKQLNDEELDKVNGGSISNANICHCPNCDHNFDNSNCEHTVVYGSGCSEDKYKKCPNCGHEYK